MIPFSHSAELYDSLYREKEYESEASAVLELASSLRGAKEPIKSAVSFGCGTGRYEEMLLRFGLRVHGVDISSEMIKIALDRRKKLQADNASRLSFEVKDISLWRGNEEYDLAVFLFHVVNYLSSPEELRSAFKAANSALKKSGVIIFDSWHAPGVIADPPKARVKETEYHDSILVRTAAPKHDAPRQRIDVTYEYRLKDRNGREIESFSEIHKMRYLFPQEIQSLLAEEGFSSIHTYSTFAGAPLSDTSWNAVYAARKV